MFFIDEARIFVKAGDGGKGCESFYRDKYMRYPRPDGGDGGKGGDLVFTADNHIQTLLDFKYNQHYQAQKGGNASSKGKKGKIGQDCFIRVPVGTILRDHATGLLIRDLNKEGQTVIVAKGGAAGKGNAHGRTPTAPQEGETKVIDLELKLIADVGLIGFPNAGKSTLISNISKVKSKIASYPFTTKQPILGVVEARDGQSFIIADLPGIIEGAHEGRGLGLRFLRHAERTKILVHLVDMGGTEGRDPLEDYLKINEELEKYSEQFNFKHKIVVANKMDLADSAKHLKRFRRKFKDIPILAISALEKNGLDKLVDFIGEILCKEHSLGR